MSERIILESDNDYAKKLKKTTTMCVGISAIIFVILMMFFNSNEYTILAVLDICFFVVSLCLMILQTQFLP